VKCLIEVYINFTSVFDHGHGPLSTDYYGLQSLNTLCFVQWPPK